MKFILILIFIIITFRLAFSMFTRFLLNKIRKSANQGSADADTPPTTPVKKKKISKEKGDYVDFEEIE